MENNVVALTTIDKFGKPHAIAVADIRLKDGKIVITDNFMNETVKNLSINNDVALLVWNREWEKSCVGFEIRGKAKYHTKGKWRDFIKIIPEHKDFACKGAIVVSVRKIKRSA